MFPKAVQGMPGKLACVMSSAACPWLHNFPFLAQERQFQWVLREYSGQETIPTRALLNYLQMEAQVLHPTCLLPLSPCTYNL